MQKIKNAVILAAGLGSRLKNRTELMPKGFLQIDGISLIERSIDNLIESGIENIIIGTGYHSEYYEALQNKYSQIVCEKNNIYAKSGSMYTLYNLRNIINEDFLLLESDLLYDKKGIEILIQDNNKNVILASGETKSEDEVYIEADKNMFLINMSKKINEINHISGELVGISKVSIKTYKEMCSFAEKKFVSNKMLDYEYAFVEVAKKTTFYIKKIDDYVWCEIDDENHLKRAIDIIYPKILRG